jgi:hypothetical protein
MKMGNLEEIKKLGAPFKAAEVHVSRSKKVARLILLVDGMDGNYPAMNFPIQDGDDIPGIGKDILAAAGKLGLIGPEPDGPNFIAANKTSQEEQAPLSR